jgi:hypothetical protein
VCNKVIQNELVLSPFCFVMDKKPNSVLQDAWRLSLFVSHVSYAPAKNLKSPPPPQKKKYV